MLSYSLWFQVLQAPPPSRLSHLLSPPFIKTEQKLKCFNGGRAEEVGGSKGGKGGHGCWPGEGPPSQALPPSRSSFNMIIKT